MLNNSHLRDAFNREVLPNRSQASPNNNTNNINNIYNLNNNQGPSAYDTFGSSSGAGSATYATFNSNAPSTEWPSYNTSPSFTAPAPSCGPCNTGKQFGGQHGGQYGGQQGQYGGQQGGQYGGQQGGAASEQQYFYGNPNEQYGGGEHSQTMQLMDQQQPASYSQILHELNNIGNGTTNQVDNRSNNLTASHESVNDMLVSYLATTIKYIASQLKIKPDWVDLSPDGGASWKYSSMIQGNSIWCRVFTKVEVYGERKAYKYPLPYIGNIMTTTKIKLDCELLPDMLREFPMMSYCQATKTLQLTMDSLEHNLAMLSLICACQKGYISINRIKYHELAKKYMLLTTPGHKNYKSGAKYSLIRQIRK